MIEIQTKLRATKTNYDDQPGTWQTPINPDGDEAARYIQNMIEHMGHVVKIALENIEDEATRRQIEAHAYAAIKGVQNENGAVLGNTRKPLAR
jgi:formiminotetrahydrofolate cyclodeaminase